jgi:hypothetical protein
MVKIESMALALSILGGVIAAAVAAVLAHRLTSRRDQANRRSDLRVGYLLGAYRTLADTAHRNLDPAGEHVRSFEQGLADIQLLGSEDQAAMAVRVAQQLATEGHAEFDDLLLSLRDDLREELALDPVPGTPLHMRITAGA